MYYSANGMDMDTGYDELEHYGVQGMKWGIRKYVNYDGSLTPEGKKKYGSKAGFEKAQLRKKKIARGVAIGAGAAAAAGGAYLAYRHFKNGGNGTTRIGANRGRVLIEGPSHKGGAAYRAANGAYNRATGYKEGANFTARNANGFTRARGYAQRAGNMARGAADRVGGAVGSKVNDARRWADSHMGARYKEVTNSRLIGGESHKGGAAYRAAYRAANSRAGQAAGKAFSSARGAAGRAAKGAAGYAGAYADRARRETGAKFNDARKWVDSHMGARYKDIPNNRLGGSTVSRAAGAAYRARQGANNLGQFLNKNRDKIFTAAAGAAAGAAGAYVYKHGNSDYDSHGRRRSKKRRSR